MFSVTTKQDALSSMTTKFYPSQSSPFNRKRVLVKSIFLQNFLDASRKDLSLVVMAERCQLYGLLVNCLDTAL